MLQSRNHNLFWLKRRCVFNLLSHQSVDLVWCYLHRREVFEWHFSNVEIAAHVLCIQTTMYSVSTHEIEVIFKYVKYFFVCVLPKT